MVFRPQKTKFQLKVVENIQTLTIWANNPWRRYSLSLITLLVGYFFGSSLGMVSAVVELMDPVAAFLSVVFIEFLIALRRNFRFKRKKKNDQPEVDAPAQEQCIITMQRGNSNHG